MLTFWQNRDNIYDIKGKEMIIIAYCRIMNLDCTMTQDTFRADNFSNEVTVLGLKDCSVPFCPYKGKKECLYYSET